MRSATGRVLRYSPLQASGRGGCRAGIPSWTASEADGAKHVNVLQHLRGDLTNHLSSKDKQELLGPIEDYWQRLAASCQPSGNPLAEQSPASGSKNTDNLPDPTSPGNTNSRTVHGPAVQATMKAKPTTTHKVWMLSRCLGGLQFPESAVRFGQREAIPRDRPSRGCPHPQSHSLSQQSLRCRQPRSWVH